MLLQRAAVLALLLASTASAQYAVGGNFQMLSYFYDTGCQGQAYTASLITVPGRCLSIGCIGAVVDGRPVGFRVTCPDTVQQDLRAGEYVAIVNQYTQPECTGSPQAINFYAVDTCIPNYGGAVSSGLHSVVYSCDQGFPTYTACEDNACSVDCQSNVLTSVCNEGVVAACWNPASSVTPSIVMLAATVFFACVALFVSL